MRLLTGVLIGVIATACSNPKTGEQTNVQIDYSDSVSIITPPSIITWTKWFKIIDDHKNKYELKFDSTWFTLPMTKVLLSENYDGFLYESQDSTLSCLLVTFDKNKYPIDTLALLGGEKTIIPTIIIYEEAEIKANNTINLYDSVKTKALIKGNETVEVMAIRTTYRVLDNGKIQKIN